MQSAAHDCHEPKLNGHMNIRIIYYTMIIIKNNNIIIHYDSDIFDNIKQYIRL